MKNLFLKSIGGGIVLAISTINASFAQSTCASFASCNQPVRTIYTATTHAAGAENTGCDIFRGTMQGATDDFVAMAWDGTSPGVYAEFNGMSSTLPLSRADAYDPDVALLQRSNCNYGYPYVLVAYLTSDPKVVNLEIYGIFGTPTLPVPVNLVLLQTINIAATLPPGTPKTIVGSTINIDSDQFDKYVVVWDHPDFVNNKSRVYCYTGYMNNNCTLSSQGAIVLPLQSGVTPGGSSWSTVQAYQPDVSIYTVNNWPTQGNQDIEIQFAYVADNSEKVIFEPEKFWDVYNAQLTNLTHGQLIFGSVQAAGPLVTSGKFDVNTISYSSPSVAVTKSAGPGTGGQQPNYGYSVVVGSSVDDNNGIPFNYILGYVYSYDNGIGGEHYQTFSYGGDPLANTNHQVGTTGWPGFPNIPIFDFNESGFYSNYSPKITYDRRSFNGNLGNAGYLTMAWGFADLTCGEQAPVSMYGQVIDGSKIAGTLHEHNNLNIVTAPSVNSGTFQNEWGLSLAGEQGFNLLWAWLEDDVNGTRYVKYKLSPSGRNLRESEEAGIISCNPLVKFDGDQSQLRITSECSEWMNGLYEIFSVTGQLIYSGSYQTDATGSKFRIKTLPPSVYLLQLTNTNQQRHAEKFIVH